MTKYKNKTPLLITIDKEIKQKLDEHTKTTGIPRSTLINQLLKTMFKI